MLPGPADRATIDRIDGEVRALAADFPALPGGMRAPRVAALPGPTVAVNYGAFVRRSAEASQLCAP